MSAFLFAFADDTPETRNRSERNERIPRLPGPIGRTARHVRYYPFHSELSSINIAAESTGQRSILVRLREGDPVLLAAEIVEWRRTLTKGSTWAWRTSGGTEIYVLTAGFTPEHPDIRVVVIAGPIPPDCCLDLDLDTPTAVEDDTLYRWLGDEIANDWPFEHRSLIPHSGESP